MDSPKKQLLYLFGGGVDKRELYNDIWTYDPTQEEGDVRDDFDDGVATTTGWSELTWYITKLPSAREFHTTFCNHTFGSVPSQENSLFVFGGYDYGYEYFNDVWTLSTSFIGSVTKGSWIDLSTPDDHLVGVSPPPRANAAVVGYLDRSSRELEMWVFGGRGANGTYEDMWATPLPLSVKWRQTGQTAPMGPLFGMAYGISYSPEGDLGMVIFGGANQNGVVQNGTWFYTFPSS